MGFIDFVKEAGKKLGLGGEEPPAAKPAAGAAPSPEDVRRANERRRSMALVKTVQALGIQVDDLSVRVDGDVATVSGRSPNQAEREKAVLAVGNTAGIARVDDRIEVPAAEPAAVFHTVVSGDTLSKIAKKHYGNAMKYPVIFEANRPELTDPDKIYPGQVLRIPHLGD